MTTTRYDVEGLTCGDCLAQVLEHVHDVAGVTRVRVDLVTDGSSSVTVTSRPQVGIGQVRDAVGEAGFELSVARTRIRERAAAPPVDDQAAGHRSSHDTEDGGIRS
ncbi:MAG: heavy-metal-associated domain-containing protein [Cellulomonas sp.]|jgi:copper chaperone CopZ